MKTWIRVFCFAAISVAFGSLPIRADQNAANLASNANLELARQLNQAFVQVAEQVSPSVVVINVVQRPTHADISDQADDEDDPLNGLRRWFRENQQQSQQPPAKMRGQASGVIIRKNGYILTNRHVVENADKIDVRLKDGRVFPATVRGTDGLADIAVIKIDANDLPVAKLADSSKTRVGEFAIAIGAPFSLDYSVTFGHISARDRSNIPDPDDSNRMMDQSFLQTDANINPGNSGGPLVNIDGEVVGINTLINGLHTGIGFAIPINLAREVADKLITDGKFARAWLGIDIQSLRDFPEFRGVAGDIENGVVVVSIFPNGPAAKSELRPADIITAIDGKRVVTSQQLKDEVRARKTGQSVKLDVFRVAERKGRTLVVTLKTGEYVDNPDNSDDSEPAAAVAAANAGLGLSVDTLTHDLASKFGVDLTEGVIVTAVQKTGLAARNQSDIKPGDVITSIDQKPIKNLRQYREALKHANTKRGVILNWISRDGTARFNILKEDTD